MPGFAWVASPCGASSAPHARRYSRSCLCFARKVCHFAMKGLPLGLHETISGFWERSTGVDERATSYHVYVIIQPVISQKRAIDPKVCRIVRKICREKSVSHAKIEKTLRNFMPFLTARVCFRFAITAKLSDNVCQTSGRQAIPLAGTAMLCSLCIAGS